MVAEVGKRLFRKQNVYRCNPNTVLSGFESKNAFGTNVSCVRELMEMDLRNYVSAAVFRRLRGVQERARLQDRGTNNRLLSVALDLRASKLFTPFVLVTMIIHLLQVRTKDREFSSVQELVAYHLKNSLPIISSGSQVTISNPVLKH